MKIARHCTLSGLCSKPGEFYTVTSTGGVTPCLMREDLAMGNIEHQDVQTLLNRVDYIRSQVITHPFYDPQPKSLPEKDKANNKYKPAQPNPWPGFQSTSLKV